MEDSRILNFLSKHWSKFVIGILVIACIAFWGERLFRGNRSQSQQDFLIVNQVLNRFNKGEPLAEESIEVTENILKRHPELHPKLDAMLAATFFAQNNVSKGKDYAETTLTHVQKELHPLYREYAVNSLLIAEKQYSEALSAAQHLDHQLQQQSEFDHLYLMNLLRLVFLAKETKQIDLQKETWEKLRSHPEFTTLESIFHEGKLTLYDYIQD